MQCSFFMLICHLHVFLVIYLFIIFAHLKSHYSWLKFWKFFVDSVFGVVSKELSSNPRLSKLFLILSSRNAIVSHFIFRVIIYFELIFLKGVSSVSRYLLVIVVFLACRCQLFQHHLLKDYLLFILLPFPLCQKSVDYMHVGLFLNSLFCSIDLFVSFFFLPLPHFCYHISRVSFEVR